MAARVFNIGVMVTSGVAALWLMDLLMMRFAISEVSVALESGAPIRVQSDAAVLVPMVGVLAVDSLGYLAAAIQRELPKQAMLLLVVNVLTLLVAARSTTRDRERSRRMRVLFDLSRSVQSQTTSEDVLRLLCRGRGSFSACPQTLISDEPVSRPLEAMCDQDRWLLRRALWRRRAAARD